MSWRLGLVAAVLGGVLALGLDRMLESPPATTAAPASEAAMLSPPAVPLVPPLADPGPARGLVSSALPTLGVSATAIEHGVYPLRGPGRARQETLPLVSFTCPADRGCQAVFQALERRANRGGFSLVGHAGGDRPGRALHRAILSAGRPALALRAYPPGPRVTVLLTGVGRSPHLLEALLRLDGDVTYAVSAGARDAPRVAGRLTAAGREVIAHLPMEPMPPVTPDGSGYLSMAMDPETIRAQTVAFLDRVPGAVGANTHQGGRLTASRHHMEAVLGVLAERGLFFLDGRATDASVAAATARAQGVRVAVRTHRLDGPSESLDARLKSIEVALALEGHAVVLAEASRVVIAILPQWLRALRSRRVSVLRLSEIVL